MDKLGVFFYLTTALFKCIILVIKLDVLKIKKEREMAGALIFLILWLLPSAIVIYFTERKLNRELKGNSEGI